MTAELKQIEEDVAELRRNHKEFAKKQAKNEGTLTGLAADIKAHFKQESGFESTLRNIDDAVKNIELKLLNDRYDYYKSLQAELHPVYDLIRDNKADFAEFKIESQVEHTCIGATVERKIQYQAGGLITFVGAVVYLLYASLVSGIDKNAHNIEKHVDAFTISQANFERSNNIQSP